MEGFRLNGTFGNYRRSTVTTTISDEGNKVDLHPGDKVFVSFVSAARDPKAFPNPDEVLVDRPIEPYIHYCVGAHSCLGKEASMVALTVVLRTEENGWLEEGPKPAGAVEEDSKAGWVLCVYA